MNALTATEAARLTAAGGIGDPTMGILFFGALLVVAFLVIAAFNSK